jgi:peptidoglycan/LPS O-acetylase OafA/YrhL
MRIWPCPEEGVSAFAAAIILSKAFTVRVAVATHRYIEKPPIDLFKQKRLAKSKGLPRKAREELESATAALAPMTASQA